LIRGFDNCVDVRFRQVALEKNDFLADAHELASIRIRALLRDTFQRFIFIADRNVGPAHYDRASDQAGHGSHYNPITSGLPPERNGSPPSSSPLELVSSD
jgi:hypothetical protein